MIGIMLSELPAEKVPRCSMASNPESSEASRSKASIEASIVAIFTLRNQISGMGKSWFKEKLQSLSFILYLCAHFFFLTNVPGYK
jgi:hypothetical protein